MLSYKNTPDYILCSATRIPLATMLNQKKLLATRLSHNDTLGYYAQSQ